jgi:hypothetical protein
LRGLGDATSAASQVVEYRASHIHFRTAAAANSVSAPDAASSSDAAVTRAVIAAIAAVAFLCLAAATQQSINRVSPLFFMPEKIGHSNCV